MVVLITGASSGIGRAIASFLSDKGYQVFGTSRKAENGDKSNGFTLVNMDVTNDESVSKGVEYILKEVNTIEVLINNAGIGMVGSGEDSEVDEMKMQFETNFYGAVRVMQAVLPVMRENKKGKIVNITSLAGIFGLPYRSVYCASKAALKLLSESMRMELLKFGIYVSVLAPGDFKTKIKTSRIRAKKAEHSIYKEEFDNVYNIMNEEVHSSGDPMQVARAVHKIIQRRSPKAHYIVSSRFQKLVVHLRYWLSSRIFYKLVMNNYKVKS